jgi:L-lactate dehydrogenase (cytochrome)
MVFAGRPFIYAAAAQGRPGIDRAIQLLRDEVDRNMALLGINRLEELDPGFLLPTP